MQQSSTSKLKLSFDTVFYYVTNMEASVAFFRDTLGLVDFAGLCRALRSRRRAGRACPRASRRGSSRQWKRPSLLRSSRFKGSPRPTARPWHPDQRNAAQERRRTSLLSRSRWQRTLPLAIRQSRRAERTGEVGGNPSLISVVGCFQNSPLP